MGSGVWAVGGGVTSPEGWGAEWAREEEDARNAVCDGGAAGVTDDRQVKATPQKAPGMVSPPGPSGWNWCGSHTTVGRRDRGWGRGAMARPPPTLCWKLLPQAFTWLLPSLHSGLNTSVPPPRSLL